METKVNDLKVKLTKCRQILSKGYTNVKVSGLSWLNDFCLDFFNFTNDLHNFIGNEFNKADIDGNDNIETIFLCLTQIITCIKHMERTVKAEKASGSVLSASRQHFLDRIHWCLDRLRDALRKLLYKKGATPTLPLEDSSYVELMDLVFEQLSPYSSFKEENEEKLNVAEENAEAMFASKQIRSVVDIILSHTLAFANVALKEDKKALSALCQKVLRECIAFQDECALNLDKTQINNSNRKLKAMSLENALYQLEDYLNEALLRLVFTCFLDFEKFSIENIRKYILTYDPDDPKLDEIIADFDVNIDRTTQIGIFAIAFAPNIKMKTMVRSCLASFESLDTCIIPSLQTKTPSDIFSEILEQHFNDEVNNFKNAVQEIVDSYAFTQSYYEMLTKRLDSIEKEFGKENLEDIVQMGQFLCQHFHLKVNYEELKKQPERLQHYDKFHLILNECQAILSCADQVKLDRIIKRFKILKAVLKKFVDSLSEKNGKAQKAKSMEVFIMSDELSDSQRMFESIGISPSIKSILYRNDSSESKRQRRHLESDSLKANYSKLMQSPLAGPSIPLAMQEVHQPSKLCSSIRPLELQSNKPLSQPFPERQFSIRRKQSLRTAMFKRQKSIESGKIYSIYKNQSVSLQISEILDQLTNLSSSFTNLQTLDESFASK